VEQEIIDREAAIGIDVASAPGRWALRAEAEPAAALQALAGRKDAGRSPARAARRAARRGAAGRSAGCYPIRSLWGRFNGASGQNDHRIRPPTAPRC
jgi:hypothetical protein